ncbi:MAG: hypothetical protein P1Q69_13085, partial [Candidatus Thorarchaeota archaeon]|nr:hypothetical protein [Candidatus Thorarchaeota archaeon]
IAHKTYQGNLTPEYIRQSHNHEVTDMAGKKVKTPESKKRKRYLFKVTIVGPEDAILEKVLLVVNQSAVAVDGIRIGTTNVETKDSKVRAVTWSPRHSALDVLLDVTYSGANAVVIVLKDTDPEIEAIYREEICEHLGSGTPTRILTVGSDIDEFKRHEILNMFEELFQEVLDSKNKDSESE